MRKRKAISPYHREIIISIHFISKIIHYFSICVFAYGWTYIDYGINILAFIQKNPKLLAKYNDVNHTYYMYSLYLVYGILPR